ncbi:MAG: hypothetical protein J6A59_01595 [Lachnospiraceae bacterium]|nr:hypothetical protein [Lachnospiraceae bacterium]
MKHTLQKIITYVLVGFLVIAQTLCIPGNYIESKAQTTSMANVILFVDFQDTDHSTHATSGGVGECFLYNPQTTFDMFTGSQTVNTGLAEYINNISYGQLEIVNVFPQYDSVKNTITPFKLSKSVSEYSGTNSSEMLSEALVQLESKNLLDESVDVDLDNDGLIDNIILVAAYTDRDAEGNDVITSHKSEYGGYETVNGLKAGNYNVVTESGGYLGLQKSGVFIHEFMHSLGYPDLYRVGASNGSTALPVGYWDIMSKVSYRLQYPLAYLRSSYTGWFTIPTITSDAKGYTIYSASAATEATKDNQALILKTDYSDTEFFVVEYRYKDSDYASTAYDSYVHGSGLIVYRVNTKQIKNMAGETDLIYVFRPGDTYDAYGNEAAEGDLSKSFLSAESGRTSYGSSNYEDSLEEGAITYSDGTNSGIVISNVGSATGPTISFDVSFGDGGESLGGFWNTESTKSVNGLTDVDSFMDADGNIYVVAGLSSSTATGTTGSFQVYKYSNLGGWSQLGDTVSVNGGHHKLVMAGDKLYVACVDYGNTRVNLYEYDSAYGWVRVYRTNNEASEFDIVADGEKLYIAYTGSGTSSGYATYCEAYEQSREFDYGVVSTGSYPCNPVISMHNGAPVVVVRDAFGGNSVIASRYDEATSSWKRVGNAMNCDSHYAKVQGDTLYLMKNGDGNNNSQDSYVFSLNLAGDNSTWAKLGTNTFIDSSAVPMSMFFHGDNIYITYQDGKVDSQDVYVKTLVNNKWKSVGTKVTRDGILGMDGTVYDDTIYLIYGNSSSGITIKTHEYEENADDVGGDSGTGGETGGSGDSGTGGEAGGSGDSGTGGEAGGSGDSGTSGEAGGTGGSGNAGNSGSTSGNTGGSTGSTGGNTGGSNDNTDGSTSGSTGSTGNAGGEGTAIPFVAPKINVNYRTHIQTYGWEGEDDDIKTWESNGSMSGTSGESKRLEGINIVVNPATNCPDLDLGIQYTTHCQSYGWLPWSSDGDMNGTEGESKRLEAIMIQLTGEHADYYDVYYRVHAQNYGWLGWASNGQAAGTAGYSKRLEGIQIVVVKKGESFNHNVDGIKSAYDIPFDAKEGSSPIVNYPSTSNTNPVVPGTDDVNVAYRTHVQTYGWQGWKYNGQMSGTSGESKRLEGIEMKLTNKDYEGGIAYTTHVQTYGWQGADLNKPSTWKADGEMAGTSGESKRLEAICITLTGEMAEHYDIYYRVHAQTYGWLGWAKNGAPAGTAGLSRRLEGIQVVIVPKTNPAPSVTYGNVTGTESRAFIQK